MGEIDASDLQQSSASQMRPRSRDSRSAQTETQCSSGAVLRLHWATLGYLDYYSGTLLGDSPFYDHDGLKHHFATSTL